MKETITKIHCDICGGVVHSYPWPINFITFSGESVWLYLMAKDKESHESVQMDICPHCVKKIEKFLENMESKENE